MIDMKKIKQVNIKSNIYLSLDQSYISSAIHKGILGQNELVWKKLNSLIRITNQQKSIDTPVTNNK